MSELEDKLNNIIIEKEQKIKPENIKKGTNIFGIEGILEEGTKPTGTIDITTNGTTDVTNYASANVNVPDGADKYFTNPTRTDLIIYNTITTIPLLNTSKVTSLYESFYGMENLKTVPLLDTSNVTNMYRTFGICRSLVSIPKFNTSKVTNMAYTFSSCLNLETIPLLDTSKVTSMSNMFACTNERGSKLKIIPLLDTSNVTDMERMFEGCESLETIPNLNTSKVTNMAKMFSVCYNLIKIPLLDASNVTNIGGIVGSAYTILRKLTTINGFKNLGKGYLNSQGTNVYGCTFNLEGCPNLTHESLMNVINNLYDIKTKGVKPQKLQLGSTNLAKLTPEEIAIATNKGWNVS